jgi:hypothetical protein
MLLALIILLFVNFSILWYYVYINNIHFYLNVKNQRHELVNWIKQENKKIFKKESDFKIDYINNQLTRDFTRSFDIYSTWYTEYLLHLYDYTNFTNPKIYVYIYKNNTINSLIDNVNNDLKAEWKIRWSYYLNKTIDLDNLENWFYEIQPDNWDIIIKGTDLKVSLQFFFVNDDGKWVIWELKKIDWNSTIKNIIKQKTQINKEQIENYFKWDWLNSITILNF